MKEPWMFGDSDREVVGDRLADSRGGPIHAAPETETAATGSSDPPQPRGADEPVESSNGATESEQTTHELLRGIIEQLRSLRRADMFDEFSVLRLIAGIVQVGAVFCMLIGVWLLMNTQRNYDAILTALVSAGVLQLMALTFYVMRGQK